MVRVLARFGLWNAPLPPKIPLDFVDGTEGTPTESATGSYDPIDSQVNEVIRTVSDEARRGAVELIDEWKMSWPNRPVPDDMERRPSDIDDEEMRIKGLLKNPTRTRDDLLLQLDRFAHTLRETRRHAEATRIKLRDYQWTPGPRSDYNRMAAPMMLRAIERYAVDVAERFGLSGYVFLPGFGDEFGMNTRLFPPFEHQRRMPGPVTVLLELPGEVRLRLGALPMVAREIARKRESRRNQIAKCFANLENHGNAAVKSMMPRDDDDPVLVRDVGEYLAADLLAASVVGPQYIYSMARFAVGNLAETTEAGTLQENRPTFPIRLKACLALLRALGHHGYPVRFCPSSRADDGYSARPRGYRASGNRPDRISRYRRDRRRRGRPAARRSGGRPSDNHPGSTLARGRSAQRVSQRDLRARIGNALALKEVQGVSNPAQQVKFTNMSDFLKASPFDAEYNLNRTLTKELFYEHFFVREHLDGLLERLHETMFNEYEPGRVVFLKGYAGNGKTTLLQTFRRDFDSYEHVYIDFQGTVAGDMKAQMNKQLREKGGFDATLQLILQKGDTLKSEGFISPGMHHYIAAENVAGTGSAGSLRKWMDQFEFQDTFACLFMHAFFHAKPKQRTIIYFDNLDAAPMEQISDTFLVHFLDAMTSTTRVAEKVFEDKELDFRNDYRFIFTLRDANDAVLNAALADRGGFDRKPFPVAFKPNTFKDITEKRIQYLQTHMASAISPLTSTVATILDTILNDDYFKTVFLPLFNYNYREVAGVLAEVIHTVRSPRACRAATSMRCEAYCSSESRRFF